jgi:hypothetical protein
MMCSDAKAACMGSVVASKHCLLGHLSSSRHNGCSYTAARLAGWPLSERHIQ